MDELWEDGRAIDRALREAVREALLRHKKLGESIVIWKDGKVVWVPPEEIEVADLDADDQGPEVVPEESG
jgi:hypothetical protein